MTKLIGFVVPDVTVPINRTAGLLGGLDWNSGYNLAAIMNEIATGKIPESVMTDHALRIVATMYNYNKPQTQYPDPTSVAKAIVRDPSTPGWIRKAGSESIVLLKNSRNTLPLSEDVVSLGVFGANAANLLTGPSQPSNFGDYQGDVYPSHLVTGGGSASAPSHYIISPLDALSQRASRGTGFNIRYILSDNYTVEGSRAINVRSYASNSQHCLVFINSFAKEGADRRTLADPAGDKLVQDVARFCTSTIVVINAAGVRLVDQWIENPNVTVSNHHSP
jgi:beta-glucosidase